MKCPSCGDECIRDEVDIGVGMMCGPPYCRGCGWSEPVLDLGLITDVDDEPFAPPSREDPAS